MAGLALIARELGHRVTGSDQDVYPPMSEVLGRAGIDPIAGYDPAQLEPAPDVVVVGNSMTRGNPCVEHILETGLTHASGPAWLSAHVLAGRHVVAVAGTHGKTTTTAMIAVILEAAGLDPGFLVGGVPRDLDAVARVGRGGPRRLFVIEADEYDTAFFDKRSKFVHYRPRTLVLNNLEFDHADIFRDLADMQRQFHHVVRIVPAGGRIVAGAGQRHLEEVLAMGCWTPVERVGDGGDWSAVMAAPDGGRFQVRRRGLAVAEVEWEQRGAHNVANALAAIAAARHAGVEPAAAARALGGFTGIARRLEHCATVDGVALYDDFAHHPTAIAAAIAALRASRASESRGSGSRGSASRGSASHGSGNRGSGSHGSGSRGSESRGSASRGRASHGSESRGSHGSGSRGSGSRGSGSRGSGSRGSGSRGSGSRGSGSGSGGSESRGSGSRGSESRGSGSRGSGSHGSGSRGSGTGAGRLLAVLELASNTMRRGTHRATLGPALAGADAAWVLAPARASATGGWDAQALAREDGTVRVRDDIDTIVRECCEAARPGDAILMMSNAGFGGIRERLAAALRARTPMSGNRSAGA